MADADKYRLGDFRVVSCADNGEVDCVLAYRQCRCSAVAEAHFCIGLRHPNVDIQKFYPQRGWQFFSWIDDPMRYRHSCECRRGLQ